MASLLSLQPALAADWERLPAMPEPNGGFICGVADGAIVVAGGTNWRDEQKRWLDRVWRFEPARNRWSEAPPLPRPAAYAAVAQGADAVIFFGGSDGTDTLTQVVQLGGDLVARPKSTVPEHTVYGGAAIAGGSLYVLGGAASAEALHTLTNRFFAIDLADGRTRQLAAPPGNLRMLPLVVAVGDHVLAFTGAGFDETTRQVVNTDAAQSFSLKTGRWTPCRPYPLAIRGLAGCVLDDRHILLAGGYDSGAKGFTTAAFVYDVQEDCYRPVTPLPYPAMPVLVRAGDQVYCLGGEDKARHRTDAVFRIPVSALLAPPPPHSAP